MSQKNRLVKMFEDKEKQIVEQVSQLAQDVARKEFALLEFELFYETMIPQESKEHAEKALQNLRQEKWKKALKEANNDEEKALFIYDAS